MSLGFFKLCMKRTKLGITLGPSATTLFPTVGVKIYLEFYVLRPNDFIFRIKTSGKNSIVLDLP